MNYAGDLFIMAKALVEPPTLFGWADNKRIVQLVCHIYFEQHWHFELFFSPSLAVLSHKLYIFFIHSFEDEYKSFLFLSFYFSFCLVSPTKRNRNRFFFFSCSVSLFLTNVCSVCYNQVSLSFRFSGNGFWQDSLWRFERCNFHNW